MMETMDATWNPILRYKAQTLAEARHVAEWMETLISTLAKQFAVHVRRKPSIAGETEWETGLEWFHVSCRFSVVADQKHRGIYDEHETQTLT